MSIRFNQSLISKTNLQGDILAPFLFTNGFDYMLQRSIYLMKANSFTLNKAKSRKYPSETIMGANYTDDQVLLVNIAAT